MKLSLTLSLGIALALLTPAADAVPLWVGWGIQDGTASLAINGQSLGSPVYTGAFEARQGGVDGTSLGYVYCVDLEHSMNLNRTMEFDAFETTHPDLNQAPANGFVRRNGSWAAWLYYNYGRNVTNASQAGAMQVALWEILYDGDANLRTGNFALTGSFAHESQAQAYLALAPAANWVQAYYRHTGSLQQDIIGPMNPVPEPGTILLLGSGLLAVGAAFRRRMGR